MTGGRQMRKRDEVRGRHDEGIKGRIGESKREGEREEVESQAQELYSRHDTGTPSFNPNTPNPPTHPRGGYLCLTVGVLRVPTPKEPTRSLTKL